MAMGTPGEQVWWEKAQCECRLSNARSLIRQYEEGLAKARGNADLSLYLLGQLDERLGSAR
jgi:hypothetical protein